MWGTKQMKTKTTVIAAQVPAPATASEKQPPATSAELCERLRRLSEDMHRVSADLRYYAGFNTDQSEWCRQLWSFSDMRYFGGFYTGPSEWGRQLRSFADLPKTWANKIETRGAK